MPLVDLLRRNNHQFVPNKDQRKYQLVRRGFGNEFLDREVSNLVPGPSEGGRLPKIVRFGW